MNDVYREIYLRAREYWNTRFNDFHVPVAYEKARELLLVYRDADPDVVVPAILLHDVGWKSIPEDQQVQAFRANAPDKALARFHETEGMRIANEILSDVHFDPRRHEIIVKIIDGHDSRSEALSLEDSLVKDADRLWRFTATAADIDHHRFNLPLADHVQWLEQQLEKWMYTARGKEMAQVSLAKLKRAIQEVGYV